MRYFQVKTVQGERRTSGQGYYDYSRNKFVLPNGRSVHTQLSALVLHATLTYCIAAGCQQYLCRISVSTISLPKI